jgi:uncharacterized membrane protein YfcA
MITDPWFYAVAIPAVLLMGLSKGGGFAGVGIVGLPLMSLVIPPLQAVTIILPILMVQDIVGVWAFRKDFSAESLKILIPASCVGMTIGYFTAATVSNAGVMIMVGTIAIVFVVYSLLGGAARRTEPAPQNLIKGSFWSTVSAFTSFIANAGAPPFQVYMIPLKLPPKIFAGTAAMYFAFLNYVKFFAFMHLGQVTMPNLATSAVLFPLAIAATFVGLWTVSRIDLKAFYRIVYVLTFLIGIRLVWAGLQALDLTAKL